MTIQEFQAAIAKLKGSPFLIKINGWPPLVLEFEGILVRDKLPERILLKGTAELGVDVNVIEWVKEAGAEK